MINLTVKTLDSQNRSFSVPDEYTVEQFKQHIAEAVSIPVESQRLIYCGRVLDDEKNLTDYNLDGKVVHLVERLPPSRLGPSSNSDGNNDGPSTRGSRDSRADRMRASALRRTRLGTQANGGNAMYLGAMAIDDLMDGQGLNIPQLGGRRLLQSRFDLATYMAEQLDQVVHRLEQASNPDQASAPEQPEPPTASESIPQNSDNTVTGPDPLDLASFLVHATVAGAFGGDATVELEIRPETEDQSQDGTSQNETADNDNTNAASGLGSSSGPSSASNENENQSSSSSSQRRPQATPANLGALLQRVEGINDRFRPFLRQFADTMVNDPTLPATGENSVESLQRVMDGVSEGMHFQGHLQHAISELMYDLSESPPRSLRCRPLLIQQPAVFQSTIPIQAVIPTRNAPSSQNQSTSAPEESRAQAAERDADDEDSADREMEIEVDGGDSAEPELVTVAEPPAFLTNTPSPSETQPADTAANGASSTNTTSAQNQNQSSSSSSNSSTSYRRSRVNFPGISGRQGGRRSGLSSLIPNMSSCFDPFLPCNSHHIRERRRNYFFPPGAAIGRITTVTTAIPTTAIPATVEVTATTESQASAQQPNQGSGNQGTQDGATQGGSAESDQNAQGRSGSVRLRFFEDAMSRFNSTLLGNSRGNNGNANGTQSGNSGSRPRAQAFIGMSPIMEMISEPVINLVANSDGQSRVIRLPAGNYASMFSEMATEMANAVSQAASASSQANQSILSSLLQITSESLSFDEIITSQNGNIPLMNIFSRLQSFIQRRIPSVATYQPNSSSPSDLILNSYHLPVFRRPVREVLSELEDSVKRLLEGVPMRNEQVDVISSVMNVIEVELYMFLGILVYSSDSRSFQRMMYCELEHFARKLFHVLFNCCQNGLVGVHQIAQAFIASVMSSSTMSISQIMKMWIVHATVSFLRANLIINPERSDLFVAQQISEEGASGSSSSSSSNGISSSNRSGESSSETSMAVPTTSESSSSDSGSTLSNLMQIISQNVTLGDAVRLSCGIRVSLANVGRQLEDFLRRRFPSVRELQRGQLVIDIIRNSYGMPQLRTPVRELYGELRATVGSVLPGFLFYQTFADMREGVDAVAAVMDVIESRLYVFLGVLFLSPDWEQFEVTIRSELNLLVRDLITTVYNCCERNRDGLLQVSEDMLSGIIRSNLPQPLKMWVVYTTISYLRTMLSSNMQRSSETVRERAAHQSSASATVSSAAAATPSRELPATASAPVNDVPVPTIPRSAPAPERMESESIEAELPPLNSSLPNEPLPEVSIGSEGWHNHLRRQDLQEWVPIITRDAQYQRRQSPQRPYSDAYLSGMPNKRRRLITAAKPPTNRVSQFISESLERAITSADVGTSSVTSSVVQHAAVDPTLRSAYVQQLRARTDLSSNPDFNPSKYPNASNYFKKK
ncbi:uncharacterized protein [Bemisia tabaci]|uniref:uncharacterized protein isoform X1 n=1 Tax=Bemisia tabaci TaxID=7038 RepID=UPI003B28BB6F